MKKIIKKEVGIYLFLFFILSIVMHYAEWFSHPIEHIKSLPQSQFGPLHPLFFTFFLYIFILIIRLFMKIFIKSAKKGSKKI